jgi:RND superfamily putative drug exporter
LTVVLVVLLLILIYQAPLLALIPLATVYLAVQLALNILALLAGAGHLTLFQGIQIYITILAYGAGVDYCRFLMARYREELDQGKPPAEAVAAAVGGVGSALVASAATVMCGIGMMVFAQFGKFREAGLAIPLSLFLVLCATLTFGPSLLCLAGRWASWPQQKRLGAGERRASKTTPTGWRQFFRPGELERMWQRTGQLLLRRPGTVWLVTVAVMTPFVVVAGLLYGYLTFDVIGDLPATASSTPGTRLLQEHFPAGIVGPVTVLLVNENIDFSTGLGRDGVAQVTDRLRAEAGNLGLADVRSLAAPLGITSAAKREFLHLDVPAELRREETERVARQHYSGDVGDATNDATRLDLILNQSPFSRHSVEDLARVDETAHDASTSAAAGRRGLLRRHDGERARPGGGDAAGPGADRAPGAGQRVRRAGAAPAAGGGARVPAAECAL